MDHTAEFEHFLRGDLVAVARNARKDQQRKADSFVFAERNVTARSIDATKRVPRLRFGTFVAGRYQVGHRTDAALHHYDAFDHVAGRAVELRVSIRPTRAEREKFMNRETRESSAGGSSQDDWPSSDSIHIATIANRKVYVRE